MFDISFLSDPTIFAVNRLPASTFFTPELDQHNKVIDLNGSWYFKYDESPVDVNYAFKEAD